jgi:centromere/kinetochore protein ZW10
LPAQHIESRILARDEGLHIATTGNVVTQDWDAAWDSDEPKETALLKPPTTPNKRALPSLVTKSNRISLDEERKYSAITPPSGSPTDDDAAEAWGWGGTPTLQQSSDSDVSPNLKHLFRGNFANILSC